MVARSNHQAKLKLAMAAGGATIFIFLAVLGGVVGRVVNGNFRNVLK